MKNILSKTFKAAFLALVFGAVTVYAANFVGPTGTPATYNAPLPINVSMDNQFKQGGIGISSLLIGPGTTLPGATNASILGKLGVGPGLSFATIPTNGISAVGTISSARGFWTLSNVSAGMASLSAAAVAAAGPTGAVIADKFCFSTGVCTTTWGGSGSGAFPAGTTGQTLFYQANGTAVTPTSTFMINGWTATTSGNAIMTGSTDNWQRLKVENGGLHIFRSGTDALFLNNTAGGATMTSVISNVPSLNFYSTDAGGHNSDIYVRDLKSKNVYASDLANSSTSNVCADGSGKLILCSGSGPGTGNPTVSMQVYQVTGGTQVTSGTLGTSNPSTFTVPSGVSQITVEVIGGGGGSRVGGVNGGAGGGGAGSSRAYVNVSPGTTFSVAVGRGGSSGSCTTNTDGTNSAFTGGGYSMNAEGGGKATCTGGGPGGQGLSGSGSQNSNGAMGDMSYGGPAANCSLMLSPNPPCSPFNTNGNTNGYGEGGYSSVYPAKAGIVIVSWSTPSTSGSPVLASGSITQTVSFQTAGSHSWTVPAGVTSVSIQVIGAGGGGGGGTGSQGGHGGGGGGYINAQNIPFTPGQTFTMSVGTRGNGGSTNNPGTDGGDTIFNGTAYRATGGKGATTSSGGVGGTATGPLGSAISGTNGTVGSISIPFNGGSGGISGGGSSFTAGQGGDGNQGGTAGFGDDGTNGAVVITYN
jgi:hypothetical protein